MTAEVIAKSYWRSILRGTRTLDTVPAALRDAVQALANAETGGAAPAEETEG